MVLLAAMALTCSRKAPDRNAGRDGIGASAAKQIGTIEDRSIREASGIAASRRTPDIFWVINDSRNPPVLYGIAFEGQTLARFRITNAENRDWEDMAAFTWQKQPFLLIADVGDNAASRDQCSLYLLPEPKIEKNPAAGDGTISCPWRIDFCYEDGPRDCEAVAVDPPGKRVLLLSKRNEPPVLYELPLQKSRKVLTARRLAPVTTIPPPTEKDLAGTYGRFYSQPTAMDISRNGRSLAILTYKHAYIYPVHQGQPLTKAISAQPQCLKLPYPRSGLLTVREALCFCPESQDLLITGENTAPPIFKIKKEKG